jgi:hypothetical protein
MPSQRPIGDIDLDELIEWIKRRPELRHLRDEADRAKVDYRPGEASPRKRIGIAVDRILRSPDAGLFGRLRSVVWVPVRNMRGRSYATPTTDATVNATAKLMSISTLWDFFCTLPLFKFGLAGPLGLLSWPGAVLLSFLILWASNVAGEKATDRHDANHARTASLSLAAFLLLSLAKTAFSGVGIDLFIGSRAVASRYAEQLIEQKISGDRKELERLEAGGPEFKAAQAECTRLKQQLGQIDRSSNENAFQSSYVLAYGSNAAVAANAGLSAQALINKYGSVGRVPGACTQENLLRELNTERARDLRESIESKSRSAQSMPALAFLQKEEPEIYAEHFREEGGRLQWVNGTTAVAQATDQFWAQLLKGEFGLLGFALFFLLISLILTGTAALLIYQLSQNAAVKASYSPTVMDERDGRLQAYREAMKARKEGF